MIKKLENGITFCKMGDGTLFSGVVKNDEGEAVGIVFTKTPESYADGVIFQITSMQGLTGFILPIITLVETWYTSGTVRGTEEENEQFEMQLQSFKDFLEPFKPKVEG